MPREDDVLCPECHTPLLKQKTPTLSTLQEKDADPGWWEYRCTNDEGCSKAGIWNPWDFWFDAEPPA